MKALVKAVVKEKEVFTRQRKRGVTAVISQHGMFYFLSVILKFTTI